MLARCLVACALLAIPARASAQAWSEQAIVARALERASLDGLAEARAAAELGAGRAERAWPGLELSYTREQTYGFAATSEDYLGLALPLDLANRRGLRGEAYGHRARAARHEVDEVRRERVAMTRRLFHRVIASRARVAALDAWLVEMEAVLASVSDRVSAGDASRYEALRLERERATGLARRDLERAALLGAEAELSALIGADVGALELASEPLPDAPPELAELARTVAMLPRVRLWDEHEAASRLDAESAARGWVPELSVSIGWKGVDASMGRSDGFYAGVVLALPVFDLGVGARQRAEAQGRIAAIERELARADVERQLRGAHAEATSTRDAARTFAAEAEARSAELVHIASASYAAGEASLLELLDAERGALEDRLAIVDLSRTSWDARIALDRLSSERVP